MRYLGQTNCRRPPHAPQNRRMSSKNLYPTPLGLQGQHLWFNDKACFPDGLLANGPGHSPERTYWAIAPRILLLAGGDQHVVHAANPCDPIPQTTCDAGPQHRRNGCIGTNRYGVFTLGYENRRTDHLTKRCGRRPCFSTAALIA